MSNIQKIRGKGKASIVTNIFVSALVFTTKISQSILERVHKLISNIVVKVSVIILTT